jgi:hypothetical protein
MTQEPQEPQELAANEWGAIIYHPQWDTLELKWGQKTRSMSDDGFKKTDSMHGTVEKGAEPVPHGPASFPTGWFETRERMFAWLTS